MMLYLVTGGGGFLGRHLVARLQERGDCVRIFSRGDYPDLAQQGVQVLRGRLTDPAALDAACAGVDGVFHVAAKTGIAGRYPSYAEANIVGTRELLAACLRQSVRHLVYTSTPSVVFGEEPIIGGDESLPYPSRYLTHYAATKAQAEAAVLAANGAPLRTCALRPHLIWGPGDTNLLPRMVARARAGRLLRVGDGLNLISVSYVENTALAHLAAMSRLQEESAAGAPVSPGRPADAPENARILASSEQPDGLLPPIAPQAARQQVSGRAFFINEAEPVNCWEFINRLLTVCGAGPVARSIPFEIAYAAGFLFEQLGRLRPDWEPPMTRFLALQLAKDHYFSPIAAQVALRWQPEFSIADGLSRLGASIRSRPDSSTRRAVRR